MHFHCKIITWHNLFAISVGTGPNICFNCDKCFNSTTFCLKNNLNKNIAASSIISAGCSSPIIK